ncbi:hypothetical protein B0J18DRAFT_465033 [Chaetomium sp. MPI-SDFR-AT-0129]|nr:hypothetical protein B0J18DRAFT_465033 [Chaetomium sp. MPI-SDFR-AT-0129]
MSKDSKESRHKSEGVRQPHRKDSISSVLSWAVLQGKITTPKASASSSPSTSSSSSSTPLAQSPQSNSTHHHGSRPRRHSHSTSTDSKAKARRGSTAFRRLSLSFATTIHDGASTKTRHTMTSTTATQDSKALSGATKAGRSNSNSSNNNNHDNRGNHSSERAGNKATLTDTTMDTKDTTPLRPQSIGDKSRPVSSPGAMPKSILRISSPDGYKRPRPLSSHGLTSDAAPPGLAPSPLSLPSPSNTITVKDPPSTTPPPSPPITRPMSPGTTVRFAKATIHRVEVGPGRRFMPVKRKSKSTLTYISPLDPGTQRGAPKTMLQSPTKLRRHQENQAAMGRYWLRTEEEEAQWRAEAEKRAEEEAERYRNEPASPPPSTSSGASVNGDSDGGGGLASKVKDVDKLSLLSKNGPALDKVEEEEAESEDGDEEAGARCDAEPEVEPEVEPVPSKRAEMEVRTTKESVLESRGSIATTKPAVLDSPVSVIPETPAVRPSESKSFSQRLADKRKEAGVRAIRTTAVPTATFAPSRAASPSSSSGESSGSARSSSSFLAQQPPRTSTTNLNPVNTQPSNPTRIEAATAPAISAKPATSATPIIAPVPIRQQLTRSPSRRASRLLSRPSSRSPANSPCSSRSSSCSSSRSFAPSEKDKTTANEANTPTSPRELHTGPYPQLQHAHLARPLSLSSPRSTMSLRASSSSSSGGSSSGTEEPRSRMYVSRSISHGNMNLSGGGSRSGISEESAAASWSSGAGGGVNHLHLSGRRGSRRFLEEHKEGIVA